MEEKMIHNLMFLAMGAPQGGQGGGSTIGMLLPIIVIMYFVLIRPLIKRRNVKIAEGKIQAMDQTNKRILGIVFSVLGGAGAVVFGLYLSKASNSSWSKDETIITYGVLTGVFVIFFIIGIIMIANARVNNK